MNTKTALTVRLFAGEVLVAESSDSALWQDVLARVTGVTRMESELPPKAANSEESAAPTPKRGGRDPLSKFAASLDATVEQIDAALSPTEEEPYIRIEPRRWATFVRNLPERGPGAVPAIVIASTALCLWLRSLGQNEVPFVKAKEILDELGAGYHNASRSINNCAWLQLRGDNLRLDPSNFMEGEAFLRGFVLGERSAA